MTAKEFEKILDDAEVYFDCYGYEGILNIISIFFEDESKEAMSKGHVTYANGLMRRSDALYDALEARGYYDRERRS